MHRMEALVDTLCLLGLVVWACSELAYTQGWTVRHALTILLWPSVGCLCVWLIVRWVKHWFRS